MVGKDGKRQSCCVLEGVWFSAIISESNLTISNNFTEMLLTLLLKSPAWSHLYFLNVPPHVHDHTAVFPEVHLVMIKKERQPTCPPKGYTAVISAFRRLRQRSEFKASLSYTVRPHLIKINKQTNKSMRHKTKDNSFKRILLLCACLEYQIFLSVVTHM